MKDFYKTNLKVLKAINPDLHGKLESIETNKKFEIFADIDSANVNILDIEREMDECKTQMLIVL